MPHVVVTGPITPRNVFDAWAPWMEKTDDGLRKATDAYLDAAGDHMLVDCLSIEAGDKHRFFAAVSRRDDGVVVRLHPSIDPPKTVGVKSVLARIARDALAAVPGTSVGETNLNDLLG